MTHQWHETYRHLRTPAHHLDPRSKLLVGFAFVGFVLFTPKVTPPQLIGYLTMLALCAWAARIPLDALAKRLMTVLPFVALMTLSMWVSSLGASHAMQVLCKSLLSMMAMAITTFATPFPDFLRAMQQCHFPKLLVLFLAFLYRYSAVIAKETLRLERGWTARYFGRRWNLQWLRLGNVLATLFVRSYERAERVYSAMLARGFSRETVWIRVLHFGWEDACFVAAAAVALVSIRWGFSI
jgi:cobalt/nickel transport system permease protein